MSDKTIYVGNLPNDVREKEVEDIFYKYGDIRNIDIKARCRDSPAFAFVQFEDHRDAKEAVRARDGYDFDGKRLRVEFPRGMGPRGPGGRPVRDNGYRGGDRGHFGGRPRRSNYRLIVEGLPRSGSWQDIKDHLKKAGEICYANVDNGEGVVEFDKHEDLVYAIRKYDDTKFTSHKGETAYIRLREDKPGNGKENSRSRSASRSKSPVRRRRSRSGPASKSRSRSPPSRRDRSKSGSRSPVRERRSNPKSDSAKKSRRDRSESGSPDRRASRSRSPVNRQRRDRSKSGSPARRASRDRSPPTRDASPDQPRRSSPNASPRED